MTCAGVAASATDLVRFDCPASSGSPMAVAVRIGPTSSQDIYLVKFDVIFDPAVVAFDPPAIEGNFLDQGGVQTLMEAGTQSNDPTRLVVSITRVGNVSGVGVTGAERTVITLPFRGLSTGATTLTFANTQALDSGGASVASLQFGGHVDLTSP